ncbi:MAG: Na+/H+ antiporter subunit E [Thermoanaerobaculia bacterium]|nr:Na+/H+ antiporter subunit E [Thermoanaerobaculia bacterium]
MGGSSGGEHGSESPGGDPAVGKRRRTTWRDRIFAFLAVSVLWLLWSGPLTFHHALLWGLGPASALLVVWLCDRLGLVTDETLPLELTFRTLGYVPWLAMQVVSASLVVLKHAWWPGAEISPKTARIDSTTLSDVGIVSYANSITLTPGTLSLEAESAEDGVTASILVHSLTAAGLDDLRSGAMDARIVRVEGPLRGRVASVEASSPESAG